MYYQQYSWRGRWFSPLLSYWTTSHEGICETREKDAGDSHKCLSLALGLNVIFFTSLPTSFFTMGRKGSVVWNSWCGSYCKAGLRDVNYLPRQRKSATGGQLSISSLQLQHGPLFYFQGPMIFSSLQMGLPHKCLCTLQRSSIRLCAVYWQILFCTRQTLKKQTAFGSKHSRHRLSMPWLKCKGPRIVQITDFFRFCHNCRDLNG